MRKNKFSFWMVCINHELSFITDFVQSHSRGFSHSEGFMDLKSGRENKTGIWYLQ
jgi:hypothetical protein